jgi:hypothetical protein
LALVVDGKLAVGVMGCPNWTDGITGKTNDESLAAPPGRGILMVSHVGCGTWSRPFSAEIDQFTTALDAWKKCFVDPCSIAHMARYCIVDSHTWDMMPLSVYFNSTMNESDPRDENKILLQNSCGGRFVEFSSKNICAWLFMFLTNLNMVLVNQRKSSRGLADIYPHTNKFSMDIVFCCLLIVCHQYSKSNHPSFLCSSAAINYFTFLQ